MAYKLYKKKYTNEDFKVVENYIRSNATELFVEVWDGKSEDGVVHSINVNDLSQAIHMTSKFYDNFNARGKVVELIMRDKNSELTTIYHIERNREGLSYEIINYAKNSNKCTQK